MSAKEKAEEDEEEDEEEEEGEEEAVAEVDETSARSISSPSTGAGCAANHAAPPY